MNVWKYQTTNWLPVSKNVNSVSCFRSFMFDWWGRSCWWQSFFLSCWAGWCFCIRFFWRNKVLIQIGYLREGKTYSILFLRFIAVRDCITLLLTLVSWMTWSSLTTMLPWLAENGWKPLGALSEEDSFLSKPLDLLKPVVSVFSLGFGMADMAPDLRSFFATSLASLASAGLLRAGVFSGSGFGAFNACKAFFCQEMDEPWKSSR